MSSKDRVNAAVRRRVAQWLQPELATKPPRAAPSKAVPRLQPTSPPGTRVASMFFDEYPRFFETSEVSPNPGRLNLRYEAMIAQNRDILQGARVLDIASHDGRWSFAALAAGAASVIGIEGRPELVQNANDNLAHYGVASDRYEFVAGDIFDFFAKRTVEVDVVMCLGFLYHTLRYNELLQGIRRTGARHVVFDTQSSQLMRPEPVVVLHRDPHERQSAAVVDDYAYGDTVLTGRPTLNAMTVMMQSYGYDFDRLSDWGGLIRDNPKLKGVPDYAKQFRTTARYVDLNRT
jgi:hypothetical protein